MNIPVSIAEKLLLLWNGEKVPASKIKHSLITEMLDNGVLRKQIQGRSKAIVYCSMPSMLHDFLHNHYGIADLRRYIQTMQKENVSRNELIVVASDSKLKRVRTFKGFLVNCYSPIQTFINETAMTLHPTEGTFQFIHDFGNFTIPHDTTVVCIENPENFRWINKQRYLFENRKPLFVSRYPQHQSKDLIKWLESIPNEFLYFGDFDFAGIGIYLNEYKKFLADRATFFIPENIEHMICNHGKRALYDTQRINFDKQTIGESNLLNLIGMIHNHKKGLEQEVFLRNKETPL